MKVSHESPLSLLEESKRYNDYGYCLFHLMHISEYKEFYNNYKGELYLDNSAYEEQFIDWKFDLEDFYKTIEELQPDVVIVPDELHNKEKTIQNFKDFDVSRVPNKVMGVIQGKTFEELEECLDFMNPRCDMIAIPFSSKAYVKKFNKNPSDEAKSIGRVHFIREMIRKGKIRKNSLHLIGLQLPIELELYSDEEKEYIYSIDTANPIQFGMEEYLYPEDLEDVKTKPKFMFTEENLKIEPTLTQYSIIMKNIERFKQILS
jgi:hypothetical protein